MIAEKARAILAQAKADETYEGPIPQDDSKAISEAESLVEQAQTAWDQFARGPEVEAILRLASETFDGSRDKAPQTDEKQIDEVEREASQPSDNEPEAVDPDPVPLTEEEMRTTEPWDKYSVERVNDVISGINAAVNSYSENDLTALMGHIWVYEEANKRRATILTHLQEIANKLQTGDELPDDPEDVTDNAPGFADPDVGSDDPEVQEEAQEPESEAELPVERSAPQPEPRQHEDETGPTQEVIQEKRQESEDRTEYLSLVEQVDSELRSERMHVPSAPDEDVPDLPWDWTKMTDRQLHSFYGMYSSISYYKSYLLERDERMAAHCRQAADEIHNVLLVNSDKYDENGKQKPITLLEAEIENDERVKTWRQRQRKHEMYAASHRRERDSLLKLVEALSRAESMRHQEWERSGGKSGRQIR